MGYLVVARDLKLILPGRSSRWDFGGVGSFSGGQAPGA